MSGRGEEGAPSPRPGRSNLQLRIVSAIVLGLVVLLITYLGGLPFRLMSAAVAGAIFYEWCSMRPGPGVHTAFAGALLAGVMLVMILGQPATILFLVLAAALLVLALHGWMSGAGLGTVAGLGYAAAPALALVHLRADDQSGLFAILFLFAVVWTTDVMAYFTGRTLGGAKLAPSISPGKTWSGAVGGTVFAVLAGGAFAFHENAVHGVLLIALIALVLAVISQIGDLFESALKRRSGVKDSSNLIPGHGGVMDRVDGLMAAALALYLLAALLGGAESPAHALFNF
ncbi:phosphatidate cytidylyltransferase [Nitratireductor aquibiodomus]|uniref:Phosphatidate cytidylyltransferase n=1 Tax=Nitratireductor aquibiodomus TaxID=204799 RepID=A0A1H4IQB4_9HYPH|nr:phosphatidate cytidylyltransferase [Nitratireductor aquibiodomus]SEB35856.1 phosphatidate cytidylyltransferase [Nitratireductor aquibiodomus]